MTEAECQKALQDSDEMASRLIFLADQWESRAQESASRADHWRKKYEWATLALNIWRIVAITCFVSVLALVAELTRGK